jgi:energy-coupling factor transport system permease protein
MKGLFTYYEGDSFLHRRNPAIKLLCVFVVVLALALAFDPYTPVAFIVLGLAALTVLGRVPLGRLARPLLFFLLVGAPGFIGSNALFFNPSTGAELHILWRWGGLHVSAEGLRMGLTLTLRMVAIVLYSILFITTTDPTDFILALIQNAHFPYRLGYGILVAYRFMPLWRGELDTIRAAHRIRGVGERASLRGRWEQVRRYAVPLLAGAIRKAERVATAMDSKAFGALPQRTYYRLQRVVAADWALLAATLLVTATLLALLAQAGLLAGFGVVPE